MLNMADSNLGKARLTKALCRLQDPIFKLVRYGATEQLLKLEVALQFWRSKVLCRISQHAQITVECNLTFKRRRPEEGLHMGAFKRRDIRFRRNIVVFHLRHSLTRFEIGIGHNRATLGKAILSKEPCERPEMDTVNCDD